MDESDVVQKSAYIFWQIIGHVKICSLKNSPTINALGFHLAAKKIVLTLTISFSYQ